MRRDFSLDSRSGPSVKPSLKVTRRNSLGLGQKWNQQQLIFMCLIENFDFFFQKIQINAERFLSGFQK